MTMFRYKKMQRFFELCKFSRNDSRFKAIDIIMVELTVAVHLQHEAGRTISEGFEF